MDQFGREPQGFRANSREGLLPMSGKEHGQRFGVIAKE